MSIRKRTVTFVVAPIVATAAALLPVTPASAASPDVVISQVYGGGGNSGATFTNDFIELFNRGPATVDLSGWSVQYASATGTSWQVTALSGTVAAGAHYLVQEAAGTGGTSPLPAPDATGSIAMSGTNGKVALVTSATALACGTACAASAKDFVGYGTANDFETAAAPGLSNTTADLRAADGTDTDNNAADFTAGAPDPRSTGGGGGPTDPPPTPEASRIHDVQGASHVSPKAGVLVSVPGVVTAVASSGFYLQDPAPDADPATSEGIFVFTSAAPAVAIGDAASVAGTVSEFRPGNDANNLSITELVRPTTTVTAHGVAVPAPTLLGPGGLTPPTPARADAPGDVEAAATFNPSLNALDFYESLEGMLLRIVDSTAAGPTNSFGELAVLPGGAGSPRTARGGVRYTYADANPERITLGDTIAPVPSVNVGDKLPGAVDGVLDYNFGNYMLEVLKTPAVASGGITPEATRPQRFYELAIATYNVENLDPGDPVSKFDRLAGGIVRGLASPDIVSVEEIQDNNGPTDDGTVSATTTWTMLIDAIVRAGGPRYSYRSIDPGNKTDGGEPGGNIRVGFLFRTDRGVSAVARRLPTRRAASTRRTRRSPPHASRSPVSSAGAGTR
jgi:predicted extracellular nuclease